MVRPVPFEKAAAFHADLLGVTGRRIHGGRHYFDCGDVILGFVDVTAGHEPRPTPQNIYFAVDDLDDVHGRATRLDCLAAADVHGASGGAITIRPWGERSFYAVDPFGNLLCFVDSTTLFTGR